jgi:hypothetical protein
MFYSLGRSGWQFSAAEAAYKLRVLAGKNNYLERVDQQQLVCHWPSWQFGINNIGCSRDRDSSLAGLSI